MKKTILVTLMTVIISATCFAKDIEPDGIFSVDGTLWSFCYIGFGLIGFEFTPIMECNLALGFYQRGVYWCYEGYCSEEPITFYVDLGVVSIAYSIWDNFLAIMQPTIGLGVWLSISFEPGVVWLVLVVTPRLLDF